MNEDTIYYSWVNANQQYLSLQLNKVFKRLEGFATDNSQQIADQEHINRELEALVNSISSPPALEVLVQRFELSDFEKNILLLCAGVELDARFPDILSKLNGTALPSYAVALAIFDHCHWSALSPQAPLRHWNLIETGKSAITTQAPLTIKESILHYLTGTAYMPEELTTLISPLTISGQLTPVQQVVLNEIMKQKLNGQHLSPSFLLTGDNEGDRRIAAKSLADSMKLQLFSTTAYNIPVNNAETEALTRLWNREARLHRYLLLLECDKLDINDKPGIYALQNFIAGIKTPLVVSTNGWTPRWEKKVLAIHLPHPTGKEQVELWKAALGDIYTGTNGMLDRIVSQFSFSNSAIQKAASELKFATAEKERPDTRIIEGQLWKICSRHTRPSLDNLAQRIEPAADWNDLVLPEQQKSVLKEVIAHVKNRNRVYETWGFATKGSRGLGISALFAGESGTGKTMASEVLANELQLDLYKIDLSKVVNKYIGETEKNLKKIFDAAENGGAILLFDEADALFGKRSDVKDSHDRYANIEVSYLLQRMESYRGLAILTTNMRTALDKAFLRRIRFIVQFPFPDIQQRSEIWNKVFPFATPKKELDIERLSRLTITGGNIRNIAMNAAFLAASEESPVEMQHILRAAKTEYAKMEIPFATELKSLS